MKKICFSDRFALTGQVKDGSKTMLRRFDAEYGNPKYEIGEVVAVAEAYSAIPCLRERAGDPALRNAGWNSKMYVRADLMPWRIVITGRKRERLHDISDEDCLREGVVRCRGGYTFHDELRKVGARNVFPTAREAFAEFIRQLCGNETWRGNPVVTAYEFEAFPAGE